ncbi:hypothetical protein D9M68_743910 [compost metagenome]
MQGSDDVAFLDETLTERLLVGAEQHFHRDLALQRLLGSQVDLSHAALAQAAVHVVAGYLNQAFVHRSRCTSIS